EAFGVKLDVSISALFAVLGIALALAGVYLRLQDVKAKDDQLRGLANEIQSLRNSQQVNISAWVSLEDVKTKDDLDKLNLTCRSYLPSKAHFTCKVGEKFGNQVQLDFNNVTKETLLEVNLADET